MNPSIETGIRHYKEMMTTSQHSAKSFGSGLVDVFATPAMIALMESTALESIHAIIPEGQTSVGTEINVKHLKATPIGMKVTGESFIREVKYPKIIFEVHAWDEKGLIGIGTHTRVIVDEKVFMENLK
jgi:fluoroacetyl-CoA thioesterase